MFQMATERDLKHALGRFAVKCEAVRMEVSSLRLLCWENIRLPHRVGSELLPRVKGSTSGSRTQVRVKMERDINRWIAVSRRQSF